MKIDAWTHILSPAFISELERASGRPVAHFLLSQPALCDLDVRRRLIEEQPHYRQVIAPIPGPHVSPDFSQPAFAELARRNNEEMAEMVAKHRDQFAGFVAATPLANPDAAAEEAERSVRQLGALGVQLEEDAVNLPLHEERYEALWKTLEEVGAGAWLHPQRSPNTPGFPAETSPFLLWQVFTWPFDSTITIARLVLSGIFDRHPNLKLVAHHGGGMIPHFSGRIDMLPRYAGMDPGIAEGLARLARPPIDYFRMIYVDTAMFATPHGCRCTVEFFGVDHVLFGSDAPFDTVGGRHFVPATIADVESAVDGSADRAAVFHRNVAELFGIRPNV